MSKDLNQCNFIGRLGADPETRYSAQGNCITNFRIAVGGDYKSNGEKVEKTTWVPVVCFGKLAEICGQYLEKGKQVFISGAFSVRSWVNQDNHKCYATEINARDVQFLGGGSNRTESYGKSLPTDDSMDGDIPF